MNKYRGIIVHNINHEIKKCTCKIIMYKDTVHGNKS